MANYTEGMATYTEGLYDSSLSQLISIIFMFSLHVTIC